MSSKNAKIRACSDGGFTPVFHEIWTHYLPIIGKDAQVFYLYLLDLRQTNCKHPKYGKAWPGRQKIMDELCFSSKQLPLLDSILEAAGLVKIDRVPCGRGKPKHEYEVKDPLPAEQINLNCIAENVWKAIYSDETGKTLCSAGKMINTYISTPNYQEINTTRKEFRDYNAKDIIQYWCAKYKETYGESYVASFARDGRTIKTKLIPAFGAEKLIKIIDVVFAFYADKWSGPEYPRPTFGQMSSWLANKAAAYVTDDQPAPDTDNTESPALDYDEMKRRGLL